MVSTMNKLKPILKPYVKKEYNLQNTAAARLHRTQIKDKKSRRIITGLTKIVDVFSRVFFSNFAFVEYLTSCLDCSSFVFTMNSGSTLSSLEN